MQTYSSVPDSARGPVAQRAVASKAVISVLLSFGVRTLCHSQALTSRRQSTQAGGGRGMQVQGQVISSGNG